MGGGDEQEGFVNGVPQDPVNPLKALLVDPQAPPVISVNNGGAKNLSQSVSVEEGVDEEGPKDVVQNFEGTEEALDLDLLDRVSSVVANRPSSSLPPEVASPAVPPPCIDSVRSMKLIHSSLGIDSSVAVEKLSASFPSSRGKDDFVSMESQPSLVIGSTLRADNFGDKVEKPCLASEDPPMRINCHSLLGDGAFNAPVSFPLPATCLDTPPLPHLPPKDVTDSYFISFRPNSPRYVQASLSFADIVSGNSNLNLIEPTPAQTPPPRRVDDSPLTKTPNDIAAKDHMPLSSLQFGPCNPTIVHQPLSFACFIRQVQLLSCWAKYS